MLRKEFGSFEEYLDGGLDEAGRRDVEKQVNADPRAAGVLAALKSHRALRAAAYESYQPTAGESHVLAARMIADFQDEEQRPLWRITPEVRRLAAVAAAVVLVAGAFMAGRTTAPVKTMMGPSQIQETGNQDVGQYSVAYKDESGNWQVTECRSQTEAADFIDSLRQQGTQVAILDDHM